MADPIYGGPVPARKGLPPRFSGGLPDAPLPVHPDLPHAVAVTLLAAVDATGGTSLGALAAAIPDCDRPISAVLALVDAGLLTLDTAVAFDATCRVTRIVAARR